MTGGAVLCRQHGCFGGRWGAHGWAAERRQGWAVQGGEGRCYPTTAPSARAAGVRAWGWGAGSAASLGSSGVKLELQQCEGNSSWPEFVRGPWALLVRRCSVVFGRSGSGRDAAWACQLLRPRADTSWPAHGMAAGKHQPESWENPAAGHAVPGVQCHAHHWGHHVPSDGHSWSQPELGHKHLPAPISQGWAQLCWTS